MGGREGERKIEKSGREKRERDVEKREAGACLQLYTLV